MGSAAYLSAIWKHKQSDVMRFLFRTRGWQYRQESAINRVSRPTRPEKARMLGYKAKQGYVVYRVRVCKGGRKRSLVKGMVHGKPRNQGVSEQKSFRSLQTVAEMRAGRRLGSLRVLNSYWVNSDGSYHWYEVILVDPNHAAIRNDPAIQWIAGSVHRHRELRGLTSSGRKGRGFRYHHHGANHVIGGSRRAAWRRNQTTIMWPRRS
ncbi:Ribosomal protein L15e [Carpediemonas membranifera]|uniref:Ribosomal protein L15 n=1 Tax=Carpediemonas membranifera TaxID=201153 RepID=A0A8J6B2J7_9EUKA|nr:Ribosomal protein L15e [Carpediemonas membranifera]KAG9397548.1 Ribosomal protein L15e [Carpediemonas membranifera]|eukprot:KAG9391622.1 Ribosomal protein L15e [Carpediemonas membranifera]